MPTSRDGSTCRVELEFSVTAKTMTEDSYPVSKRTVAEKDGHVVVNDDFDQSIIKEIWNMDPDMARDHVYVDRKMLESMYPLVLSTYGNDTYPWDKLRDVSDMPDSRWKHASIDSIAVDKNGKFTRKPYPVNASLLASKNGGWVVNEGAAKMGVGTAGRKEYKICSTFPGDRASRVRACQLLTGLASLQNQKGYHSRARVTGTRRDGDGLVLSFDESEIKDKVAVLAPGKDNYKLFFNFKPSILYWVKTGDAAKIDVAIADLSKMFSSASVDGKHGVDYSKLRRWAANVLNGGGEPSLVVKETPFVQPAVPGTSFNKNDFTKDPGWFASSCSKLGATVLVDENGKTVPFLTSKGKSMTVKDVLKRSKPGDTGKWKWACISTGTVVTDDGKAIVPRKMNPIKKSIPHDITGKGMARVSKREIDERSEDIAIVSWNALALSRLSKGNMEINEMKKLPSSILDGMVRVSGEANRDIIIKVFSKYPKEPIVMESPAGAIELATSPLINIDYGKNQETHGISKQSELSRTIDAGESIVGIETGLTGLFDTC